MPIKATVQKLAFDSKEQKQKIQLRIEKDDVSTRLINVWKGQAIVIDVENRQSQIDSKNGELINAHVKIPAETISMSVCTLEDGQIWTITATF